MSLAKVVQFRQGRGLSGNIFHMQPRCYKILTPVWSSRLLLPASSFPAAKSKQIQRNKNIYHKYAKFDNQKPVSKWGKLYRFMIIGLMTLAVNVPL